MIGRYCNDVTVKVTKKEGNLLKSGIYSNIKNKK
jgi:hypothetical protein